MTGFGSRMWHNAPVLPRIGLWNAVWHPEGSMDCDRAGKRGPAVFFIFEDAPPAAGIRTP
jgi:hypothetical protein